MSSFGFVTAESILLPTHICIVCLLQNILFVCTYSYLSLACMYLNCCHVTFSQKHWDKAKSEILSTLFLL